MTASSRRRYSPAAFWRGRLSGRRTRRLLELHLVLLLVLTAVAATALFLSGRQAQRGADALAAREAPAVQGLAASRLAALRAEEEIDRLVELDLIGVAGSGEAYRSQLSAADQGLSRIADRTDQDLGTVKGLLATYSDSLARGTSLYRDDPLMRTQRLAEAESLLARDTVGVAPRLKVLQRHQLEHAEAAASMGWWQHAGWWAAEAALLGAVLTLLSALFVLRDRCGRDWNPYLLAALVLTVLLAVVPLMTAYSTQGELDGALDDLRRLTEVSWQGGPAEEAQQDVTEMSEEVGRRLADGTWTESVYRGALVGGLLAVVLPALGLGLRLDRDYWRRW